MTLEGDECGEERKGEEREKRPKENGRASGLAEGETLARLGWEG